MGKPGEQGAGESFGAKDLSPFLEGQVQGGWWAAAVPSGDAPSGCGSSLSSGRVRRRCLRIPRQEPPQDSADGVCGIDLSGLID